MINAVNALRTVQRFEQQGAKTGLGLLAKNLKRVSGTWFDRKINDLDTIRYNAIMLSGAILVGSRIMVAQGTATKARGTADGPYRYMEAVKTTVREIMAWFLTYIVLAYFRRFSADFLRSALHVKDKLPQLPTVFNRGVFNSLKGWMGSKGSKVDKGILDSGISGFQRMFKVPEENRWEVFREHFVHDDLKAYVKSAFTHLAREREKPGQEAIRVLKRTTLDDVRNAISNVGNKPLLQKFITDIERTYPKDAVPIEGIASLAWKHTKRENSLFNMVMSEVKDYFRGVQTERPYSRLKFATERNAEVHIKVGEHFDLDPKDFSEKAMGPKMKAFVDTFAGFFKTAEAKKLFNSANPPKHLMRHHVDWNQFFQFMPIILGSVPAVLLSGFMSEAITQHFSDTIAKKVTSWRNQKRIEQLSRQAGGPIPFVMPNAKLPVQPAGFTFPPFNQPNNATRSFNM